MFCVFGIFCLVVIIFFFPFLLMKESNMFNFSKSSVLLLNLQVLDNCYVFVTVFRKFILFQIVKKIAKKMN